MEDCEHTTVVSDREMRICVECGSVVEEGEAVGLVRRSERLVLRSTGYVCGRSQRDAGLSYKDRQVVQIKNTLRTLIANIGGDISADAVYGLFEHVNKTLGVGYGLKGRTLSGCVLLYVARQRGIPVLFSDIEPLTTDNHGRFDRLYRQSEKLLREKRLVQQLGSKEDWIRVLARRIAGRLGKKLRIDVEELVRSSVEVFRRHQKMAVFSGCRAGPLVAACVFVSLPEGRYAMTEILQYIEAETSIRMKTAAKRVCEIRRLFYRHR
ncbi:MAG: uncharacterized protein A8A55_1160 [Amphiamblys sp. WSBS2006]|nr:MAG: uncharacterized protein A8A55_1160 [Amphiamblys sp. WSBS2006]